MGKAAYTRAKREFTLENMRDDGTLRVYREIMRG